MICIIALQKEKKRFKIIQWYPSAIDNCQNLRTTKILND